MKNSKTLHDNVELFLYLPNKTILSSATMIDVREISEFIEYFKKRWKNIFIEKIYSNEIPIGCDILSINGEYLIPHFGCTTKDELKICIDTIKQNPFLGRLYTVDTAITLWRDMVLNKINSVPNIDEMFKDVDNLSSLKVKSLSMDMLDKLANSENIEKICKCKKITDQIDLNRLGTTNAYKMVGMTLIACHDPIKFCKERFKDLIEDMEKRMDQNGYKGIVHLIRKLDEKEKEEQKKIKKINEKIKSDEKIMEKLKELKENVEVISCLDDFQINTERHAIKYADGNVFEHRNYYPIEGHPRAKIPDWAMELLICGVGIYAENELFDSTYINHIFDLASNGQLSYLVADNSIVYGTNYPFNKVIIEKEFAEKHSINTIFQLMGRSGRVGQSWSSKVFVDEKTKERIMDFIHGKKEHIELDNMSEMFHCVNKPEGKIKMQQEFKDGNKTIKVEVESNWFNEMKEDNISNYSKKEFKMETTDKNNCVKEEYKTETKTEIKNNKQSNFIKREFKMEMHSEVKTETPKKYVPPHLRK
jgi:hypothetical protein